MWPELEALLVIPSNAHALFARPLVTEPDSLIAVETVAPAPRRSGVLRRPPHPGAAARAPASKWCGARNPLRWIRLDSAPFADRMVRKFELPVTGWRGRKR